MKDLSVSDGIHPSQVCLTTAPGFYHSLDFSFIRPQNLCPPAVSPEAQLVSSLTRIPLLLLRFQDGVDNESKSASLPNLVVEVYNEFLCFMASLFSNQMFTTAVIWILLSKRNKQNVEMKKCD